MVMTVSGLSKYLHVSTTTIYQYVRRGIIPHKRLGSRILFSKEKIDEWIEKGEESNNENESDFRSAC